VYLSENDLTKLIQWFNLDAKVFIENYCRWVPYFDGTEVLCLLERKNYDCILWTSSGCSAYDSRPIQCSTYPFWTHILESRKSWNEAAEECPGMNTGILHPVKEIEAKKNMYEQNTPLRREAD
jgi:hypothetical protein